MWNTFHEFMVVCRLHFFNLIVTQQWGVTLLHRAVRSHRAFRSHCAVRSRDAVMVNALLKAGSKVDEKDEVSMLGKQG